MLPDRISNPGPLIYESGALPIALRGPAKLGLKAAVLDKVTIESFRFISSVLSMTRSRCCKNISFSTQLSMKY